MRNQSTSNDNQTNDVEPSTSNQAADFMIEDDEEKKALDNFFDILKFLVSKGADFNAQDEDLNTPLHYAVQRNNYDAVSYLLKLNSINIYVST
jgi:ankyrin repeat protein